MQEYDTYIFDLDGTLLDTIGDLASSCNYALREMNMPERTLDEVRRFVGNGVRKLILRAVPEGTPLDVAEETLAVFKAHYVQHSLDTTKPYDGIMPLLQELKQSGKRVAVVSNKFYDATRELCRHFFGSLVDVAIGERTDIARKPAPDTVMEALRQLGVGVEGAVYIGDSEVDVETAANSGMPCISVLWGFRDKEFLVSHGASVFVDKPCEILWYQEKERGCPMM